jgi:hypothetical protein
MKNEIAKYHNKGVSELTKEDWITFIEMKADFNQDTTEYIKSFELEFNEQY